MRGARVEVLGRQGAWRDVRLQDGTRGWMHGTYLTPSAPQPDVGVDVDGPKGNKPGTGQPGTDGPPNTSSSSTRSAYTDAVGQATVTDGDTLRIGAARIRLQGIDAPEAGQSCEDGEGRLYPCGGRAANALTALIARRPVACRRDDTDRYGRMVGTCEMMATGESLNAAMVRSGWALAYRHYSEAYVGQEAEAKAAGRGLWQGRFIAPWDYRAGTRLRNDGDRKENKNGKPASGRPAVTTTQERSSCRIKGNVSGSGRIFHVPGSRWYDRTRIDTGAGERWFCSEDEARAAGWRAPGG